ncbi:hypothetical protein BGZ65_003061 [Modicella reniformis]|uniref:Uncharacterized protein n=1 Tax=Modicella reniformis TaxID=1440133 RepID=A0A9P6IQC7_9FUNG|nr:hypothetical protein BGZ65_003061 [Modicella reniformis]
MYCPVARLLSRLLMKRQSPGQRSRQPPSAFHLVRSLSAANKQDKSGKHHNSKNLLYPDLDVEDEKPSVEDGNWDENDVVYSIGHMVIEKFTGNGVGIFSKDRGLVTVFEGGPEAFVDHVE